MDDTKNQTEGLLEESSDEKPENNEVTGEETDNNEGETKNLSGDNSSEIYGAPEEYDYSQTELPEGMKLDEELVSEFEPIARELNLSNESANRLMQLAVKTVQRNYVDTKGVAGEYEKNKKASYMEMLDNDEELNVSDTEEYEQYLNTAVIGLKAVATEGFIKCLKETGLTHHPEFIKTFHKIGEMCSEDRLQTGEKATKDMSPAEILYGKNQ